MNLQTLRNMIRLCSRASRFSDVVEYIIDTTVVYGSGEHVGLGLFDKLMSHHQWGGSHPGRF